MTLRNQLKNVMIQNVESMQWYFTRVFQIKEQPEAVEEVENAEVVITTLNGLPRSWNSFIQGMCARRKWLLSTDFGKKKKLSPSKEDPSSDEEYEELKFWRTSYPPSNLDKKRCYYEWRRRWSWRLKKDSTHETNKDKYSIVIIFVTHLFIFSWCIMHDRMFSLMIVYY